jgi:hypothetical protein
MAASNKQAANPPTGQKEPDAKDRDVQIKQYRLVNEPEEQGRPGDHGDFVVIIDDAFVTEYDLGCHDERKEDHNCQRNDSEYYPKRHMQTLNQPTGKKDGQSKS